MMKLTQLLLVLLLPGTLLAQSGAAQREINEQVWKPFIKSFNSNDDAGFKAVHSKDIVRVIQDSRQIGGYEEYFPVIPDSTRQKWRIWTKQIELRFLQRIAGTDKAFEVGYYKTTSKNDRSGEVVVSYGKFYVVHRKEKGVWKILVDADANEGTTEAIFQSGAPLE